MQPSTEISLHAQGWGCPPTHGVWEVLSPPCTFLALHKVSWLLFGSNVITAGNILLHNPWLCFLSSTALLCLPIYSFPLWHLSVITLCCCVQPSRSKFLLWRFSLQTWLPAFVVPFLKQKFILKNGFSLNSYHIFKCRLQYTFFINVQTSQTSIISVVLKQISVV